MCFKICGSDPVRRVREARRLLAARTTTTTYVPRKNGRVYEVNCQNTVISAIRFGTQVQRTGATVQPDRSVWRVVQVARNLRRMAEITERVDKAFVFPSPSHDHHFWNQTGSGSNA